MASRLGLAAAVLFMLLAGLARAQEYQRLHVRSFTLRSDAARPQLEQPFHVTLTIRVAENVPDLSNVYLPTFTGAEDLGDQRETSHGPGGTVYRETLTLVAHASGPLTITPAYLDAIDARDGKAKRFLSNSLQLDVGGGPVNAVRSVLRWAIVVVIDLVLAAAALFVIFALFVRARKRPPAVQPAPVIAVPPVPVPLAPKDEVGEAFDVLRSRRDRGSVMHLRAALWSAAGADAGETLSDVLRRPAAGGHGVRRLLMTVERAAFVEENRLDEAIEEVLCSPRPS